MPRYFVKKRRDGYLSEIKWYKYQKMTITSHGTFFDKCHEGLTLLNIFSLGYSRNSHAKYESLMFLMLTVVTNSFVSFKLRPIIVLVGTKVIHTRKGSPNIFFIMKAVIRHLNFINNMK